MMTFWILPLVVVHWPKIGSNNCFVKQNIRQSSIEVIVKANNLFSLFQPLTAAQSNEQYERSFLCGELSESRLKPETN